MFKNNDFYYKNCECSWAPLRTAFNSRLSTSLIPETRCLTSEYYYFTCFTSHHELRRRRKHRYTTAIKSPDVSITCRLAIKRSSSAAGIFSAKSVLVVVKPTLLSDRGITSTLVELATSRRQGIQKPEYSSGTRQRAEKEPRKHFPPKKRKEDTQTRAVTAPGTEKGPVEYTVAARSRPTREECVNGTPYK